MSQGKSEAAKKLGDRAHLVKCVGYPEGVSGYRFYNPESRTITLSRSPHFLEVSQPHSPDPAPAAPEEPMSHTPDINDNISITSDIENECDQAAPPALSSPPSSPLPPLTRNEFPAQVLCNRSRIVAPSCLEPTDFGAHG